MLVVLLMVLFVTLPSDPTSASSEKEVEIDSNYEYKPLQLVNFPGDMTLPDVKNEIYTSDDVRLGLDDCILINGKTLIETNIVDSISHAILDGNPVALIGGNYSIISDLGREFGGFSGHEGAQAYGMKYVESSDILYLYKVYDMESESDIISTMYDMMCLKETFVKSNNNSRNTIPGPSEGSVISMVSKSCGNFGTMNIRTLYEPISENVEGYNYFLVHYDLQAVCNSGYSKRYMTITSDIDSDSTYGNYQHLLDYGPTTTSGTSTVEVGISTTIGTGGASISQNQSWSYSILDVTVTDLSDYSEEFFKLRHTINECTDSGYNTLKVEPGLMAVVDCDGDGQYHIEEEYYVQFCKIVIKNLWHNTFTNFYQYDSITICGLD